MDISTPSQRKHELRFRSLFDDEGGYGFPCDAAGRVDLDALSERAFNDYLYARVLVGRAYRRPAVEEGISQAC